MQKAHLVVRVSKRPSEDSLCLIKSGCMTEDKAYGDHRAGGKSPNLTIKPEKVEPLSPKGEKRLRNEKDLQ